MIERLKDAAALAQMGPGEKLLGALQVAALGTVSYTHLTLPTNREV